MQHASYMFACFITLVGPDLNRSVYAVTGNVRWTWCKLDLNFEKRRLKSAKTDSIPVQLLGPLNAGDMCIFVDVKH
jgi:hypothetical protein